ncbi:hypothetical protein B0H67DRAFT_560109 [Lasiosphaeris hirsuta]|uniref:Uncharacterized protein n=1 Tax=Lasiosphaeris hirsuta TaxID=260670 RepID=A0AA40E7J6_9PEZI|nr:hypothetical protein B0H67DRAFT_560109 [Lasiosphaeris hirsuta]
MSHVLVKIPSLPSDTDAKFTTLLDKLVEVRQQMKRTEDKMREKITKMEDKMKERITKMEDKMRESMTKTDERLAKLEDRKCEGPRHQWRLHR